ncbi:unnamed protein product [Trichobilharzia regenti]|nr:unnamed protein product [Trichobilharzia regenti]
MGRNEPRRPLSPNMRIKLGHYLLRSKITFPGPLASSLVEAAMLALDPNSLSQSTTLPNSGQKAPSNSTQPATENGSASEADSGAQVQTSTRAQTGESVPASTPNSSGSSLSSSVIQQRRLAEHGLDLLLHLSNNVTTLTGSATVAALRCLINFVYERTVDEDNSTELKLAAAHCLRRLAVALHSAQKQNYAAIRPQLVKLERLLYENIEKVYFSIVVSPF